MKFFMPVARNKLQALHLLHCIREHARLATGKQVKGKSIFQLALLQNGKECVLQVGKKIENEIIFAILEADSYLVCTLKNGVLSGHPLLFDKESALSAVYFD